MRAKLAAVMIITRILAKALHNLSRIRLRMDAVSQHCHSDHPEISQLSMLSRMVRRWRSMRQNEYSDLAAPAAFR